MPILVEIHPVVWAPNGNKQTNKHLSFIFFASRGALRNHSPLAPTSPSSGKPLPFIDFWRGMGMDGLQTGRKLVGRHRDLNPGPPACESGVLAVTLRGFMWNIQKSLVFIAVFFRSTICGVRFRWATRYMCTCAFKHSFSNELIGAQVGVWL